MEKHEETIIYMSKEKQILRNTIIYAVSNIGSKALRFFLVPFYTYYLTKYEYGLYDTLLTIMMLVVPVFSLKIADAVYRWLLVEEKFNADLLNKTFFFLFKIVIPINIIAFIFLFFNDIKEFAFFILFIDTQIFYNYFSEILRGLKKNIHYALSGIIFSVVNFLMNYFFLVVINLGITGIFMAGTISNAMSILFMIITCNRIINGFTLKSNSNFNIKPILKYSLPLIPSSISWWILKFSNRLIILSKLGFEENGLFAISQFLPSIIVVFHSIFFLAWQETSITEYNAVDRNEFYTKLFDYYSRLQLSLALFSIAFIKIVLKVMHPDFFNAWEYSHLLLLGAVFQSFASFFEVGYLQSYETKNIFYTILLGALINIIVTVIFINIIGLYAPSLGICLGYLFVWLIRVLNTKKYFEIRINYKLIIFNIILFSFVSISLYVNSKKLEYFNIFLTILSIIIVNRKIIKVFYFKKFAKNKAD